MGLQACGSIGCQNPAERTFGSCMICAKHMCYEHARPDYHKCPQEATNPKEFYSAYDAAKKGHLRNLLAKINVAALKSVASLARNGIPCRIPAFADDLDQATRFEIASSQQGGRNCHLDIVFDDGVTWIARIPLLDPTLSPLEVRNFIFLSEVATLQFLTQTSVPSPHLYHYQLKSPENPIGSSYILMEKLPGQPLNWQRASSEQRIKVMKQLAGVYLELEKHPLEMMGSIISAGPPCKIGGLAIEHFFETPENPLGPFATVEAAYTTILRQQLWTICNHEVTSLPVDNYLSFLWRLSKLPALASSSVSSNGPFYLKHNDDKGDHILVDKDYNITGIIDWETASAEPKEYAFSSPCMTWPVGKYYRGENHLSDEEVEFARIFESRGRKDLRGIVLNGRRWQRFAFIAAADMSGDEERFESLFQGLRKCFASDDKEMVSSYQDWKRVALNAYSKLDSQLQLLVAEAFHCQENCSMGAG